MSGNARAGLGRGTRRVYKARVSDESGSMAQAERLLRGLNETGAAPLELVEKLAELARGGAEAALLGALQSSEGDRRLAAALALARAGLVGAAKSGTVSAGTVSTGAVSTGEQVQRALLAGLADTRSDRRWAATVELAGLLVSAPAALQLLSVLSREGNPLQRRMAFYCMARARAGEETVLLDGLADEESLVVLAALSALGRLAGISDAALASVERLADDHCDSAVRRAASEYARRLKR